VTWIAVFFATAIGDWAWTNYVRSVAEARKYAAAGWSSAIVGVGSLVTLGLVESGWNAIPAVLGAFVGTLAAFYYDS
jgi:hypothetical protein